MNCIKMNKKEIERFSKKCNIEKISDKTYLYKPKFKYKFEKLLKVVLLSLLIPFLWIIVPIIYFLAVLADSAENFKFYFSDFRDSLKREYGGLFIQIKTSLQGCKNKIIEEKE